MPNRYVIINDEDSTVLRLDATDKRNVLVELLHRLGLRLEKSSGNSVGACELCTGVFRKDLPHYAGGMCKYCYQVGRHRKRVDASETVPKCQTCEFGLRRVCQLPKTGVCVKDKL